MRTADIDFPRELIDALRDNTLVVFAGAGVSKGKPACLPDFNQLACEIARGTGVELQKGETEDRFLGRLRQENGTDVHALAAKALSRDGLKPNDLHFSLLRLFARDQSVRLVTTNFDELFERAADTEDLFDAKPDVFRAPALPLGHDFGSIVHLHGAVSRPHDMVLTDEDFGRAYLTEGWARRFLVSLFREYTVLFVGYSHSDTDMHYLARALPVTEAKRFALIGSDDDETQLWEVRGIKLITYPKPSAGDYSALDKGIKRQADYIRRGVFEWRNLIREIARRPPPININKEDADIIEESMSDEVKTGFFTEHATSPEWVDWLDEHKHLDALLSDGDLSNTDAHLLRWLAERFACSAPHQLFLLLGRHRMCMHPDLWSHLGWQLSQCDGTKLDPKLLSRWISVLLATLPTARSHEHYVLAELGMRCICHGDYASLLQIFDVMTATRLSLKSDFPLDDDEEIPIRAGLPMIGASYALRDLWEQSLRPNLSEIAEPLLTQAVNRLKERHRALRPWGHEESRPAIESHGQNSGYDTPNILIDVARDCLEWLVENQAQAAASWRDQIAASEVPLLRRLAIHTVFTEKAVTANDKITWLLTNLDIHDSKFHHEVFRLAEQAYPEADQEYRKALIAAVHEYRWVGETESRLSDLQLTAWHHLNWFHWLHKSEPDCPLAKQARDDAQEVIPGYEPREFPDFLTWRSPLPEIRPTVEELLAIPAATLIDQLPTFEKEDIGHARLRRERNLTEAAERCFEWSLALAEGLAQAGKWDYYPWSALFCAWSAMELTEEECCEVLTWLGRSELCPKFARKIAEVLLMLVLREGKPYALRLLPQANRIAVAVTRQLDNDQTDGGDTDWLGRAMNHAAGKLALFWLCGFSVWRDAQDPAPTGMNDEYDAALTGIVQDATLVGKLGRSVLVMEVHNLLHVDRAWTLEHVLPLFNPDSDDWDVAREGLARLFFTPDVAKLLEGAFLEAAEWFGSKDSYLRDQFIVRCIEMVAHFVEHPLDFWLPKLLNSGGEAFREVFTSNLYEEFLREMDEATQREWWQRWLKKYWEGRLKGIPAELSQVEIAQMLRWPAHLPAVFSEAVALAVKMPPFTLQHTLAIHDLAESNLPQRYPKAVAQLVLHLEKFDLQGAWWQAQELTAILLEASIPEDMKRGLRELRAKKGIED